LRRDTDWAEKRDEGQVWRAKNRRKQVTGEDHLKKAMIEARVGEEGV